MAFTANDLKPGNIGTNKFNKFYADKASGGKYDKEAEKMLAIAAEPKDFIEVLELCKKVDIRFVQTKDLCDLIKGWKDDKTYAASKPTVKMVNAADKMAAIVKKYTKDESFYCSWGSFAKIFEKDILEITKLAVTAVPKAQSFVYSRACYMVMSDEQVINILARRLNICMEVVSEVLLICKITADAVIKCSTSEQVGKLIKAAGKDQVDKLTKLPEKNMFDGDLYIMDDAFNSKNRKGFPVGSMIPMCYPVDYRMALQSKEFRSGKKLNATYNERNFFTEIKRHLITDVMNWGAMGNKVTGVIPLKDKNADWFKSYMTIFKGIKRICVNLRAIQNSGFDAYASQGKPRKNYESWVA